MIYDFEGKTPKLDQNSWVAPNAVVIGSVELKKAECTAFGFKPESTEHAECVMKLAIAEKARDQDTAKETLLP